MATSVNQTHPINDPHGLQRRLELQPVQTVAAIPIKLPERVRILLQFLRRNVGPSPGNHLVLDESDLLLDALFELFEVKGEVVRGVDGVDVVGDAAGFFGFVEEGSDVLWGKKMRFYNASDSANNASLIPTLRGPDNAATLPCKPFAVSNCFSNGKSGFNDANPPDNASTWLANPFAASAYFFLRASLAAAM